MANDKNDQKSAPASTEQMLATALAALSESNAKIAAMMERQAEFNEFAKQNATKRRVTLAEHLEKHPEKRLLHEVYQNGRLVNPSGLSWKTIQRLDGLATGKYCDGLVDVVRVKDGLNGINSRIHLIYSNKHEDQKMAFYVRFPTFTSLVNQIADDMAAHGIAPVQETAADPLKPNETDDAAK